MAFPVTSVALFYSCLSVQHSCQVGFYWP